MAETLVVRLSPRRIGFFDPINGVNLLRGVREEAAVAASSDLRYIRAAVKSGGLILMSGSLDATKAPEEAVKVTEVETPVADATPAAEEKDETTEKEPARKTTRKKG